VPTTFTTAVEAVCPFCQKKFHAGEEDGVPGIIHEMPPCDTFLELEPDEFLAAVNAETARLARN
jgi:hypothetical protein